MVDSTVNSNVNNISINMAAAVTNGSGQLPWLVRALYFLFIGFWFAGLWITLAYAIALTIIGLPLANTMFNKTASVMTLQR